MAKKYLLYIHDELFDSEPNKSKLVNNLLERHYHDTVDGGKTQEQVLAEIKVKQEKVSKQSPECPRHHVPMSLCAHRH